MSLHTDLPIYRTGVDLVKLAFAVQQQMPRTFKRTLGEKITVHCTDMLDLMAMANASRGAERAAYINPRKTVLQFVERGIDFVGHVIKPWRRTTRPRTVRRAVQRLATMPASDTFAAGNSYLGVIGQASHSHHDRSLIANVLRDRGHAVKGDLSKIYRRATS